MNNTNITKAWYDYEIEQAAERFKDTRLPLDSLAIIFQSGVVQGGTLTIFAIRFNAWNAITREV